MNLRYRGLVVGLLAVATAVAPAATASAESSVDAAKPLATLNVGKLILEPTDRGYVGTLPATVTWNGPDGGWLDIEITESVAAAWQGMTNGEGCVWSNVTDGRRTSGCIVVGFRHGETKDITQQFRVLTATRPYAMSVASQNIWATQGETQIGRVQQYSTTFRGTNGSLKHPQPYVQDTLSNASITTDSSPVTMVRQEDGTFRGRVHATVTWKGDAPHFYLNIDALVPDGWIVWDTDPTSGLPCAGGCAVPNGEAPAFRPEFMQGDTSTFDLVIYAPEGTPSGTYGPITGHIGAQWVEGELADVTPADNDFTFSATVA